MRRIGSVVSHGHASMLLDLLQDMAATRSPLDELVITLNLGREDASQLEALAARLPFACRFVRNPQPLGFGANHNQAFRTALPNAGPDDVFLVLNPDLRWRADPIFALAQAALAIGIGVAAPRVYSASGQVEDSWRETLTPWQLFKRYGLRQRHAATKPDWAAGMCLAFRAQAYAEVGGFDQAFFMYCEDMDLGLRLRDAGWQTAFCGDVSVVHAAQRASRKSPQHLRWHVQSLLRFWWRRALA